MTNQPHREYIYRMAFEMGRHIIGYEVQKVLAGIDWFVNYSGDDKLPIGVMGYGEGGLLAFYSAAVDERIEAVVTSGYFQSRQDIWEEPIYRNVWGILHEFGDAGLASLVAPRTLIVEASAGPEIDGPPTPRDKRHGAAPGRLVSPPLESVESEFSRAHQFYESLGVGENMTLVKPETADASPGSDAALNKLLSALGYDSPLKPIGAPLTELRENFDPRQRLHRQVDQLVDFTQKLLHYSQFRRREFWSKADSSSIERWEESRQYYRDYLRDEVVGNPRSPDVPMNPRTRLIYDEPNWIGYEVVLDVWLDAFAHGILLLPKDLKPGERRPVVVCQHGYADRPQKLVDPVRKSIYNNYAAKLADRGFIVYAPQNPYLLGDSYRVIQRKANPLKLSLFSLMVRQQERTLDWLCELPFVDPERIASYGLSYGGKTVLRLSPLMDRYAVTICSGDFSRWIKRLISVDQRSNMFGGGYEMYEFGLGDTFNHSDLANLIAPRPFMVERGHHDGVSRDESVAYEYAPVRRLYAVLGIPERTEIEFFDGPHMVNGKGTFDFLHRWLSWPKKDDRTED